MTDVAIVDTGGANIASVRHALVRLGRQGELVDDPDKLGRARHVILPGVGAAGEAMDRLRSRGLAASLSECQRPVLGICLGLQLLCESSEEDDRTCLGVLLGRARRLEPARRRPVPHMGWNTVATIGRSRLLEGVPDDTYFYFVHSFALPVLDSTRGVTRYGKTFSSVVEHQNFFGTQFHPERSSTQGAKVLGNFLGLD